jgi:hypothetical protein
MDDHITSKTQIPDAPYYVLTNDKFMSGWGMAEHKINTLIFVCDSYKQAQIVEKNALGRTDQTRVRIVSNKPKLNNSTHYYQLKTQASYDSWYDPGYFYSTNEILVHVHSNGKHTQLLVQPHELEEIIARCGWSVRDELVNMDGNWWANHYVEEIEKRGYAQSMGLDSKNALLWWKSHTVSEKPELTPDM